MQADHHRSEASRATRLQLPSGLIAEKRYGPNGRLAERTVTAPTGESLSWRYRYDSGGLLKESTAPDGGVTRYHYDGAGMPLRITGRRGNRVRIERDGRGRITRYSLEDRDGKPLLKSTRTFDRHGHLTRSANAMGESVAYRYDAAGRVAAITDPRGHTTSITRDALGRVDGITDPAGAGSGCATPAAATS